MAQIEFSNVSKDYMGEEVLKNTNLSIEKGEFVFIVGASGAGKSTLIKMLIREERPTSGTIYFDGQDIAQIPQEEIHTLRRKIGVVFQDFKLLNSKNVYDNVAIALEVGDAGNNEVKSIVPNVLGMVGLENKASSFPQQLSGGEKQRVAIARALAHEPDVLIADEPTGNIDPNATQEIIDILEKINDLGTTVIMSTHDYNIVNKLKKRVIRIDKGTITSDKVKGTYNE